MKIFGRTDSAAWDYFKTKMFVAGILIGCLVMNAFLELTSVSAEEPKN